MPRTALRSAAIACAGSYHACAIRNDGELEYWGANDYGQTNIPPPN